MKSAQLALAALTGLLVAAPLAANADGGGGGMGNSNSMPSGSTRADPVQAYQAGVTALQARNYAEAIRELRTARRAAPDDGQINYALGLAYVGATELDDARGAFERAARALNAPADARRQLGLVYLQLSRRDDAVAQQAALARAVTECDAACGDAQRAALQAAHDQLAAALAPPADAPAAADPATTGWNFPSVEEGRAAYAEAVGLINQERFGDAFHALTRAEAAVGPHPDVLNYMGFASRKMGRYDAALGYYHQALAINPNHLGANEYLGELYIQMGDISAARTQLARLDQLCAYGCEQREELARWIATAGE
jgi:tetratricopeptide (TPR) repeat protein